MRRYPPVPATKDVHFGTSEGPDWPESLLQEVPAKRSLLFDTIHAVTHLKHHTKEADPMSTAREVPRPTMAISDVQLKLPQVQAAMKAMMDYAQERSPAPVCMAIVDASGNLEAFAKMDIEPSRSIKSPRRISAAAKAHCT